MTDVDKVQDSIEGYMDRFGMEATLDLVRNICYGKAFHLEANWQDAATAKQWEKAGQLIGKAILNIASQCDLGGMD